MSLAPLNGPLHIAGVREGSKCAVGPLPAAPAVGRQPGRRLLLLLLPPGRRLLPLATPQPHITCTTPSD